MTENTVNVPVESPVKDEVFTITINKTKLKKYSIIAASCLAVGVVGTFLASKSSEMVDVETDFNDGRKHDVTIDLNTSE